MKEIIEKIKTKKSIHYMLIVIVSLLVSIPMLWIQIRTTDDGWLHLIRMIGLEKSIESGDFPFLVFPYICRDFGYSMTAFYPPIVLYIPYILSFIGGNFVAGLKTFALLTIVLSGIFMYQFINVATKNRGISILAAIIYMIFPYRFEVIFNRFAIGEFTAFVFIPIVFKGLYNLLHEDKKKHYWIAIGAIGLLLSHTISTVYTALFCIIYIIFNIKEFLKKDVIIKCIVNVVFILLVSSLFIIPMLEFKSQAEYSIFQPNVMKTSGEYTQNNVIELWQFLKDKGEENGVSFIVGVPTILMLGIGIIVFKDIDKKYKEFYLINLILGIISVIMCTKFFPWKFMPDILCTIQYPWRMIGFALFFFVPVCAINTYTIIHLAKKENFRSIVYVFSIALLAVLTIMRLTIYKIPEEKIDKEYESGLKENLVISHFAVNRDYLPYNALIKQFDYLKERTNNIYVLEGECNILEENKKALKLTTKIANCTDNTVLELPYFFYPGYTIMIDNGEEKIKLEAFESENGFLSIKIPNGIQEANISIEYTGTILEIISFIISEIGLIGFIIYIYSFKKKNLDKNMSDIKVEETNER